MWAVPTRRRSTVPSTESPYVEVLRVKDTTDVGVLSPIPEGGERGLGSWGPFDSLSPHGAQVHGCLSTIRSL